MRWTPVAGQPSGDEEPDPVRSSSGLVAYNLGVSREHASRRLGALTDHGLVRRIEDGKYELTAEGRAFLAGGGDD